MNKFKSGFKKFIGVEKPRLLMEDVTWKSCPYRHNSTTCHHPENKPSRINGSICSDKDCPLPIIKFEETE